MSVAKIIHKTLNPRIAPMVYIMMWISMFIGFCFAADIFVTLGESVLYDSGVMVNKQLWGAILFTTATIAEIGFIKKSKRLIQLGGIWGFMAWFFACIALFVGGNWYILVTVGLFHLVFHGYVVLASSLDYLIREPVNH